MQKMGHFELAATVFPVNILLHIKSQLVLCQFSTFNVKLPQREMFHLH